MALSLMIVIGAGCDSATGPKTGSLVVTITGLPNGIPAVVTIAGPSQTSYAATATQTFADLAPGTYQVAAAPVSTDKSSFAPSAVTTVVQVHAGNTPTRGGALSLVPPRGAIEISGSSGVGSARLRIVQQR